jgi:hypothetical protein
MGNIDRNATASVVDDLRSALLPFGRVENIEFKTPRTGAPYAFCHFRRIAEATAAKSALNNTVVAGSRVSIGYGKVCVRSNALLTCSGHPIYIPVGAWIRYARH